MQGANDNVGERTLTPRHKYLHNANSRNKFYQTHQTPDTGRSPHRRPETSGRPLQKCLTERTRCTTPTKRPGTAAQATQQSRIACRRRERSCHTTDYRGPKLRSFAANSAGGSCRKNCHGQLDAITTGAVLRTCKILRSRFSARADPNLVGHISF